MRRFITVLLVAFFPCLIFAQEFHWGVEAGMNLTHFKGLHKLMSEKVGGMKLGGQVGVTVDYEFKRHWMLLSGLTFMNTKSNMKLGSTFGGFPFPDTEIKLNHLVLPVKVGYNFRIRENLNLIPSIGLYAMWNFNAGSSSIAYPGKQEAEGKSMIYTQWKPMDGFSYVVFEDPRIITDGISPLRKWTYGGVAGLKAVIGKHYTVSLDYFEALKRIHKMCSLRDYGLQLSVGYRF